MQTYIVTNDKGVLVRGKPDTKTGYPIRKMAAGEAFTVIEIITTDNNQKWARLTDDNDVTQEYCCIQIANKYFARPSASQETFTRASAPPAMAWAESMDAWARTLGYQGPRP